MRLIVVGLTPERGKLALREADFLEELGQPEPGCHRGLDLHTTR